MDGSTCSLIFPPLFLFEWLSLCFSTKLHFRLPFKEAIRQHLVAFDRVDKFSSFNSLFRYDPSKTAADLTLKFTLVFRVEWKKRLSVSLSLGHSIGRCCSDLLPGTVIHWRLPARSPRGNYFKVMKKRTRMTEPARTDLHRLLICS